LESFIPFLWSPPNSQRIPRAPSHFRTFFFNVQCCTTPPRFSFFFLVGYTPSVHLPFGQKFFTLSRPCGHGFKGGGRPPFFLHFSTPQLSPRRYLFCAASFVSSNNRFRAPPRLSPPGTASLSRLLIPPNQPLFGGFYWTPPGPFFFP